MKTDELVSLDSTSIAHHIMKDWDAIYESRGVMQTTPSPRVVRAVSRFRQEGVLRVLDLGCGTGRHTTLLVDAGFEVCGCDVSEEALHVVSGLIEEGDFRQCDMTSLPYASEFFDAIICNHVIQHGMAADAKKAVEEMLRVLRPGGFLHLIVASTEHPKSLTGREIEPGTRIDTDAVDGHIPHHFFSEDELRELFRDALIESLEHYTGSGELEPEKGSAVWEMYARKVD